MFRGLRLLSTECPAIGIPTMVPCRRFGIWLREDREGFPCLDPPRDLAVQRGLRNQRRGAGEKAWRRQLTFDRAQGRRRALRHWGVVSGVGEERRRYARRPYPDLGAKFIDGYQY